MKIGINATVLTEKNLCGIGHSLFHLLDAFARLNLEDEFHCIAGKKMTYSPKRGNFHLHYIPLRGLSYFGMSKAINALQCDIAFIPGEVVPFRTSVPTIITVYDLFPLICSKEIKKELTFKNKLHFFLASILHFKRAKLILTISEDTKKDLIERCEISADKIQVTHLGVNKDLFFPREKSQIAAILKKYKIQSPYFINTSSVWWERKNLIRLIEAFDLFMSKTRDCQLVITGNKGPSYEKMQELIHRKNLEHKIKLLEYVDRMDIPLLLSGALALVFPSLHEGFGLPILEAMSCGCPVITSNVSALPEVAGDSALFINPLDVDSIEQAMIKIYYDKTMRQLLSQKGMIRANEFSWEKTARSTLQAFYRV